MIYYLLNVNFLTNIFPIFNTNELQLIKNIKNKIHDKLIKS